MSASFDRLGRALLVLVAFLACLGFVVPAWAQGAAPALDRSTPRRTVAGFLDATDRHDDARAAKYLDLRGTPRGKRAEEGPVLARKLRGVLDWKLPLDAAKINDTKDGDPSDGAGVDVLGTIELENETVALSVAKVELEEGGSAWLVSKATMARVPTLDPASRTSPITSRLPRWLVVPELRGVAAWQWLGLIVVGVVAYVACLLLGALAGFLAKRLVFTEEGEQESLRTLRAPVRLVVFIGSADLLVDELYLPSRAQQLVDYLLTTVFVFGFAWLLVRSISLGEGTLSHRLADDTAGELKSRGVRTQLVIMRKILSLLVGVVAVAIVLLQFPIVRTVGFSLLASAGLAGVVLGVAAQKSLGGIIAGIQLSLTQPLRIGDVIMTEGEWGTVEELTLTYVVVRVWDQRRMVVPIARFLEHPFQNWTKTSSDINGVVTFSVDYTAPVDIIRAELRRICEAHALWDGRTCILQITEMGDKVVELRALVSAADAYRVWDLRCDVREQMLAFLRELDAGAHLPRLRSTAIDPHATPAGTEPVEAAPPVVVASTDTPEEAPKSALTKL